MGCLVVDQSKIPRRPTFGTRGEKTRLFANYYQLEIPRKLILHRYTIKVHPATENEASKSNETATKVQQSPVRKSATSTDEDSSEKLGPTGKKLGQIIKLFLKDTKASQQKCLIFTDFRALLFSSSELPEDLRNLAVPYRAEHEAQARPDALRYMVQLVPGGTLDISDLTIDLRNNPNKIQHDRQDLIQALNILLLHHARSSADLLPIGRRTFTPTGNRSRKALGGYVIALRGYFSSVHVAASRVLVNINISHAAFYDQVSLPRLIAAFLGTDYPSYNSTTQLSSLHAFLKGLRIGLNHLKANKTDKNTIPANLKPRTIIGLTSPEVDGICNPPPKDYHPPQFTGLKCRPNEVQFWYDSAGKQLASNSRADIRTASSQHGRLGISEGYITVFNYYQQGIKFSRSFALLSMSDANCF